METGRLSDAYHGVMDDAAPQPAPKRIRLTGDRFQGGRLPIDSLKELQSYQSAVNIMAQYEWQAAHPGQELPPGFTDSVSLSITEIRDGSADIFLAFEQIAIHQEYQAQAQDAIDNTIEAAYSGRDLPELPNEVKDEVSKTIADIGQTLQPEQSIEFYISEDLSPIEVTLETRQRAVEHIYAETFFTYDDPTAATSGLEQRDEWVIGRVTLIAADKKRYELRDLESNKIIGWYRDNPEILEDLREVVDTSEEGPVTRIYGELQFRDGEPWRFKKTYSVEQIQFDETDWGENLFTFACLQSGWAGGEGVIISSVALDAAQSVLRDLSDTTPTPLMAPTEAGGVLLEWISKEGIKSIEINSNGEFELFEMKSTDNLGALTETQNAAIATRFINEGFN